MAVDHLSYAGPPSPLALEHRHHKFARAITLEQQARFEGHRGREVEVEAATVAHEPRAVGIEHVVAQRERRLIDGERPAGEIAQGARRSSTGG